MENDIQHRLQVVLAEHSNIREEIRDCFRLHLQVLTIATSAMVIAIAYTFAHRAYEVLVIIPFLTIPLFFRWLWDQNTIMALSYYQETEIERKKIPSLVGFVDEVINQGSSSADVNVPEFFNDTGSPGSYFGDTT